MSNFMLMVKSMFFYFLRISVLISIFSMYLSIYGCEKKVDKQIVEKGYLQNDLKVGEVVRLADLINKSNGMLCVLYPYQSFVGESVPQSDRINAHLKAIHYAADESYWALLLVESDVVALSKFKRSKNLDILAPHEIQSAQISALPKAFKPVICASIENSVIAKIESKNRIYLVFGDNK